MTKEKKNLKATIILVVLLLSSFIIGFSPMIIISIFLKILTKVSISFIWKKYVFFWVFSIIFSIIALFLLVEITNDKN
jgi:hypothetical protein